LYNFGDGAGAVLRTNYRGLGLQDEYLRDGVGRDFLKLMLEDLKSS
jgi:hypothetical protein